MKSEIEQLINNSAEIIKKTSSLSGEIQKVINEIIRCLKNVLYIFWLKNVYTKQCIIQNTGRTKTYFPIHV